MRNPECKECTYCGRSRPMFARTGTPTGRVDYIDNLWWDSNVCSEECLRNLRLHRPCVVCGAVIGMREKFVHDIWLNVGTCSLSCYLSLPRKRESVPLGKQELMGNIPDNKALRYNEGKDRPDLIPVEVLIALGKHYAYGAEKYAPNNWRKGLPYSETTGSLLRHLYAWLGGERNDPESGTHHLVAVIWNAVTLMYFELFPETYGKFDDRPILVKEPDGVPIPNCCCDHPLHAGHTCGIYGCSCDLRIKEKND